MQKAFLVLLFTTGVVISVLAGVFSVTGLTSVFRGAELPVLLMGSSLELAKVCVSVYLHSYHRSLNLALKSYLFFALLVLMGVTSLGVYGYLSKSFYTSTNTNVLQNKVASYNTKLEVEREKLKSVRDEVSSLLQLPSEEKKPWHTYRVRELSKKVDTYTANIDKLNEEYVEQKTKLNVLEAEVGPLKYLSYLLYNSNDSESIGRSVQVLIVLLVVVFDPLAVLLVLSSIKGFEVLSERVEQSKVNVPVQPLVSDPWSSGSTPLDNYSSTVLTTYTNSNPKRTQKKQKKEVPEKVTSNDDVQPKNTVVTPVNEVPSTVEDSVLESALEQALAEEVAPGSYEEQVQKMYSEKPMVAGKFKE